MADDRIATGVRPAHPLVGRGDLGTQVAGEPGDADEVAHAVAGSASAVGVVHVGHRLGVQVGQLGADAGVLQRGPVAVAGDDEAARDA